VVGTMGYGYRPLEARLASCWLATNKLISKGKSFVEEAPWAMGTSRAQGNT